MYSRINAFRLVPCWRATSRARSTIRSSTAKVMFTDTYYVMCALIMCQREELLRSRDEVGLACSPALQLDDEALALEEVASEPG